MRKDEMAGKLARRAHVSKAEAADELDRVVTRILKDLRKGEQVPLPGLGTFLPGPKTGFRFDKPAEDS